MRGHRRGQGEGGYKGQEYSVIFRFRVFVVLVITITADIGISAEANDHGVAIAYLVFVLVAPWVLEESKGKVIILI